MKVILIWTAILGIMVVAIVGCGSDDSPIKEEMPQPPTEPSNPYIAPIFGTWHLRLVTVFEDGVQRQQHDARSLLFTLTFKPYRAFEVIHRYPIERAADLDFLKSVGLEHIQRIVITVQGRYRIGEKQLWLDVDRATVEPKEAPEIDSDFENPTAFFFYVDETGRADYSLSDDGNRLELEVKRGNVSAKLIHHRIKPL